MATKTTATLGVNVDVQSAKAQKNVKKFSKSSKKAFSSMEKSAKQFSLALKAAVAIFAGQQLVNGFKAVTQAAGVQEQAIQKLNTQLKLAGDYSAADSKDMQDFASSLQDVSTQGDETTLELLALAKTFGTTNEGAKQLTLAATELAVATDQDVTTAMRQLGKTLSGTKGRLGESVIAVNDLTTEQLKNGEALKLVLDQYGGSATGALETFSGQVDKLSNSYGDLLEEIGFTITESGAFREVIAGLSNVVGVFIDFLNNSGIDFGQVLADGFNYAFKISVRVFQGIAKGVGLVASGVATLNYLWSEGVKAVINFGKSAKIFQFMANQINAVVNLVGFFISGLSEINGLLGLDTTALDDAAMAMASLSNEIENTDIDGMADSLTASLDTSIDKTDELATSIIGVSETLVGLGDDVVTAFSKGSTEIKKTSKDLANTLGDGSPTKKGEEAEKGKTHCG